MVSGCGYNGGTNEIWLPTPLECCFNRLIAEDANTRQLRKIDNRGGRKNASKMRLRVYFALQLCGVKEATNHNCRRFYIVVSIF